MNRAQIKETPYYTILTRTNAMENDITIFIGKEDGLIHKFLSKGAYCRDYIRFKYDNKQRVTHYYYASIPITNESEIIKIKTIHHIPKKKIEWMNIKYDQENIVTYEDYEGNWYDKSMINVGIPFNINVKQLKFWSTVGVINMHLRHMLMDYDTYNKYANGVNYYDMLNTIYVTVRKWENNLYQKIL